MTKKSIKLLLIPGFLAGLLLLFFYIFSDNSFLVKEVNAANTISCSADPYLVDPGDSVTISAVINFTPSEVWAVIESEDGVAQSHYVLNQVDSTHYSRTYITAGTADGRYDIGIYATVSGTGEQLICNPSTGATWIKKTLSSMPWHRRNGHEVLSYNGYIWILGGFTNNYDNDVWKSLDGETWELVTTDAAWPGRKSFGSAVFNDGSGEKMWIFGGDAYTGPNTRVFYNDVWWSTDGEDWTKITYGTGDVWSNRGLFATTIYDNKIWISGGYNGASVLSEVWSTSNPEVEWAKVSLSSGFGNIALHQMVAYNDGAGERLWILGGFNLTSPNTKNNIWKANADGTSWTQLSTPDWVPRNDFSAIVYDYPLDIPNLGDKILIMGGSNSSSVMLNDVWSYHPQEGWVLVTDPDPEDRYPDGSEPITWTHWSIRYRFKTVLHNRGSGPEIFLIGGYDFNRLKQWNDVWTSINGATWSLIGANYDGIFNSRWASSMAGYAGKLWIMGGQGKNDVWSSADGVDWTLEIEDGNTVYWTKRWGHQTLIYNNKLWLIGGCQAGSGGGGLYCGGICSDNVTACIKGEDCSSGTCNEMGLNDVWTTEDGTTWVNETETTPANFAGRYEFATAVFDNKMWILGGDVSGKCAAGKPYAGSICRNDTSCGGESGSCSKVCVAGDKIGDACTSNAYCGNGNCDFFSLNDVLSSTDGIDWNLETANASWLSRCAHKAIGYGSNLYLMAGFHRNDGVEMGTYLNDVWSSSDGSTWTQATASAAWNARHTPALLEYRDKMWLFGGNNGYFSNIAGSRMDSNNVWWSTDGATWNQVTNWAEWDGRDFFSYTVFQDRMWLMGGDSNGGSNNDVWASRFSNLSYYAVQPKVGQVIVTAQVDPEISMTLPDGETCNLQSMTPDRVRTCGYSAVIATNAANGYSIYVRGDGGFSSGSATISPEADDNYVNGTGDITAENGEYGLSVKTTDSIDFFPAFTGDCVIDYDDKTTDFPAKGLPDTAEYRISYYTQATDGITHGVVDICHGVRIKADTPAGSYTQIITITAINNF